MFIEIFEKFSDIGKLSDEELKKGKAIGPNDFVQVSGLVFYNAIKKIKQNDIAKGDKSKGLETLTVYNKNEYRKMKCFLGFNNSSGYCLKDQNELVSVFSTQGSSGNSIVQNAIKNGAKHLDCFALLKDGKVSGDLYKLYSRNGFRINTKLTTGELGVPYTIQNGISRFVNNKEQVELDNPQVVIFMVR
jgi:hypothetical protein